MRRLASTLILVAILAGLVGYIYFVDSGRTPDAAEAKPKAFDVSPENIVEVEIRNVAGETTRVERVEANWLVMAPQKTDADAAAVASITSSLASLEVQRVVDEMPADLAQYGLERPQIEVAFRARNAVVCSLSWPDESPRLAEARRPESRRALRRTGSAPRTAPGRGRDSRRRS